MRKTASGVLAGCALALSVAVPSAAVGAPVAAGGTPQASTCAPAGPLGFICGLRNVEDLAAIADGRWLVGSSYAKASAGLYLIDTRAKTAQPARLSLGRARDPRFATCAPPDLARLETHGLAAVPGPGDTATVYAVNHGGRESVEVFRVDPRAGTAIWTGCLVLPAGSSGNAVAPLPGGGLAVDRFIDAGDPHGIDKVFAGQVTGLVYVWRPGQGFRVLPGSRLSGDNGLAASPDGRWLFVNDYGRRRVWRLPLAGGGKPASVTLPFLPDNLGWSAKGRLFATGQFVTPGDLQSPHAWAVATIDPRSMQATILAREPARREFQGATTTVQVGDTLWFGTYKGDRVAYRRMAVP